MDEDTGVAVDVQALLEAQAAKNELQATFQGCIKRVLIPQQNAPSDLPEAITVIFCNCTHEVQMVRLQQFAGYVYSQRNHQRVRCLLSHLVSLTATGVLTCRSVCEQLLCHLDLSNLLFWSEALRVVKEIVGGVDYKGCRDLMKLLFDRFHRIPRSLSSSQLPTVTQGRQLLAYILDRNAALLPAYFAYDEICRHYPDKMRPPHWLLQEALAPLHLSMKTLADLVSGVVLPFLRPVLSMSNMSLSTWKLDPDKYCCSVEGLLPYSEIFLTPQSEVLYHVIAQPNSRDAVHSMLGMNRQQMQPCAMVEEALVRLAMVAMEMVENVESGEEGEERVREVWSQLANKLVFFYFLQLINITSVINLLRQKLSSSHCRKGRSWLMWSLLHFVTSTVQSKLPAQQQPSASSTAIQLQREFVPVLNLFSLLYPDREPLPPPDPTQLEAVLDTAMASIWVVYSSRAQADGVELPRPVPHILTAQIKWLSEQSEALPPASNLSTDHTVALLLSVYSNNTDVSTKLLNIIIEAVAPTSPKSTSNLCMLPLRSLSTIAMHAKIRLMDKVKHHLVQVAEASKQLPAGQPPTITAALLETYSRLLIWLGTRNFQTHLIPAVFKSQAWPVLHALLEVIGYRVHLQLQYSYRFQLLQQLHTVVGVSIIPTQLFVCAENTTLRLIQGLSSPEFLLQLAKLYASDPKPLLSQESEELNRVFVCVLAQSMHISNLDTTNWLESFMRSVFTAAPQSWPEATSRFFPTSLRQLCSALYTEDYQVSLVSKAEEEYRKFTVARGKGNERELIQTYTESESAAVFLCVLWQQLLETGAVSPISIKIVQRTQAKKLAAHARKMVDYVVFTSPSTSSVAQFNKVVTYLNDLVWRYHIFPLDRLLLCMVMRGYEGTYAKTVLSLIHHMLLANQDLQTRVSSLIDTVRPDHWNCSNWHSTHAEFLQKYPETFQPEIPESNVPASNSSTMTMYFGNVCFRFLPILCLYLHRLLELPDMAELYLEETLHKFGCLFAFHAHPATHLYTTLHYYEMHMQGRPELKKRMVAIIMRSQHKIHPLQWYFTPLFCEFLCSSEPVESWTPTPAYYRSLLEQLVKGLEPFSLSAPSCDWQCSEFSGSLPLSLTCVCVELLSLPLRPVEVGTELLQALYSAAAKTSSDVEVLAVINALALIFISMPECYQRVLYENVVTVLEGVGPENGVTPTVTRGGPPSCLLALMHAFWLHGNMGLLLTLPQWLQLQVGGVVSHEAQLIYVLQLLGPILHRLMAEKPKLLLDIVMEIYRLLKIVDQRQKGLLHHADTICDFLYHIKYRHIGDAHGKKEELEQLVTSLHLPLKTRLRFLTHSLAEHSD